MVVPTLARGLTLLGLLFGVMGPAVAGDRAAPTYSGEVASILQRSCQGCHRPGQVGPFALSTYEQARKRADDIASVVQSRRMPPWKAVHGVGPKFKNDMSLSREEVATLVAWAEAGAPQGDPSRAPAPRVFPEEGWELGPPDLILEIPEFHVPASGPDIYRCFVLPTGLADSRYVTAVEFRPGNRKVVHHMMSYVDATGEGRKKDAADPGPGYSCLAGPGVQVSGDLGIWTPGNEPARLPEGIARSLPRGADIILQPHYHPTGKPEVDRSRIGLHFSRGPIKRTVLWNAATDLHMKLPAGESNIEVRGQWPVPVDVEALAVFPHMHNLGRDIAISITYPDGRNFDLLKIDDWDSAWQNTYYFEKPLDVPKGSILKVVAHFDNSAANPLNPHKPPQDVYWGEAITEEMCNAFLFMTKKGQDLTRPGERDDLGEIFAGQPEGYRNIRKAERLQREAEEAAKVAGAKDAAGKR
jgi:mono/diheme cytochrome c family protein